MTMVILGAVLVRVDLTAAVAVTLVGVLLLFDLDGGFARLAARGARPRARAGAAHYCSPERTHWERSVAARS